MGDAGRSMVCAEFDAVREAGRLLTLLRAYRLGETSLALRPASAAARQPSQELKES